MATLKMGDSYTEEDSSEVEEKKEEVKETPEEGEEKETPSESSTEEKPNAETSDEEATSEKSPEEVGVEDREIKGLTTQEQKLDRDIISLKEQLSQRIVDKRQERRDLREKLSEPLIVDKKDDLSDVSETDIAVIERVLKAKGYVKQDEIQGMSYKQQVDAYKDQWLEKHPEYLPANDPDDKNWATLNSEVSNFYKAPSNPKDIIKILDRAHNAISKGTLPVKTSATSQAAQEKVKATSKSAFAGGSKTASQKKSIDRSVFSGFSDEELNELET